MLCVPANAPSALGTSRLRSGHSELATLRSFGEKRSGLKRDQLMLYMYAFATCLLSSLTSPKQIPATLSVLRVRVVATFEWYM